MAAKKQRLAQREKARRAEAKKRLQEEGLIPPDKPRLNRRKFARETWKEFEEELGKDGVLIEWSLMRAIGFMVGPDLPQVSPEQVGVLKLLKIAVEYNRFRERLKQEGRTEYNFGELADKVIIPILKL